MYWSPEESRSPGDGGTPARPARATPHFVIRASTSAAARPPSGNRTPVLSPETRLPPVLFELPPKPKEEEPVKQKQKRRRKKKKKFGKKGAKRSDTASPEEVAAKSGKDRKESPVTFLGALADSWRPSKPNSCDAVSSHVVTKVPRASLLELKDKARSETSPRFATAANLRNAGSTIGSPAPGSAPTAERTSNAGAPPSGSAPSAKAEDVAQRARDFVGKSPPRSDRVSEKSHDASRDKNSQPQGGVERSTVSTRTSTKGSTGAVQKAAWPTSGESLPYLVAAFVVLCIGIILIAALTLRSTKYGSRFLAWALGKNDSHRVPAPPPKRPLADARGMTTVASTALTAEKNTFS
ncbi:hypothetical protein MTO96_002485 [Rhipicephalus appendiculatus]